MYLNPTDLSNYYAADIEGNGLDDADTIWCMCVINLKSNQEWDLIGHEAIKQFIDEHPEAIWVGHNFLSYDAYTLNRILGTTIRSSRVVDTYILSLLYDPVMAGGHSLEAWGGRLGFAKGAHTDWTCFSDEMLVYCRRDTVLVARLFDRLRRRMYSRGFSERSCQLEHEIRPVIDQQQRNGFKFDVQGAETLEATLRDKQRELEGTIRTIFKPRLVEQGRYKYRTRADGSPYATFVRHSEQFGSNLQNNGDGTYSTYAWEDFNLGSPSQRADRLEALGYKPTSRTPTGQAKVDEESLIAYAELSKIIEVQQLADWLVANGRANMLGTWLRNVHSDGFMRGYVNSCGAGTRRMTHSSPNTANIPKAKPKVKYGKECRQLWTTRDPLRRRLVGYDASGLEMRMFAHELNDAAATEILLTDFHTYVTEALGFSPEWRDLTVKNGNYAYIYGAQDAKLGSTFRPDLAGRAARDFGANARATLQKSIPGLDRLVKQIGEEFKSGFITCIDGGLVRCPMQHAALNYKLQSGGSLVMKQASIFLDREVARQGLDCLKVGDIHDEGQLDVDMEQADHVGKLAVQCLKDAGEELNLRVPMDGAYKIGLNWSETH